MLSVLSGRLRFVSSPSTAGPSSAPTPGRRWPRRVALGVLLAFGVVVLWVGPPVTCHQEFVDGVTVRLCETMRLADPRSGLYLLLVALLLFPEVSELEIGGVLTLRRRLDEIGGEATRLKSELADMRSEALALSQSSATNRTEVTTVVARPEQTGELLAAASAAPLDETVDVDAAAYAQLAFVAGVAGLPYALPAIAAGSTVLAYTPSEDGRLEVNAASSEPAGWEVEPVTRLVNEHPPEPRVQRMSDCWAVTAPVLDARQRLLGAVAVLLDPALPGVPASDTPTSAEAEEMGALAEVAAQVYSRLLVDLLGERAGATIEGRVPSAARSEVGQ